MLAYPGAASEHRDVLEVDAFVGALNDENLELRVRDKEPVDLDSALRFALASEANSQAHSPSPKFNDRGARPTLNNRDGNVRAVDDCVPSRESLQIDQLTNLIAELVKKQTPATPQPTFVFGSSCPPIPSPPSPLRARTPPPSAVVSCFSRPKTREPSYLCP